MEKIRYRSEKCSHCRTFPSYHNIPFYYCPFRHIYCLNCFHELKRNYKGRLKNGAICVVCYKTGIFIKSNVGDELLAEIQKKQNICDIHYNLKAKKSKDYSIATSGSFQLPTVKKARRSLATVSKNTILIKSREFIKCPHKCCERMINISTFLQHYKQEHNDIPRYASERNKEICIPCEISLIQNNRHYCIAMFTLYETNKIDVKNSKSTQSVIKTCQLFNRLAAIDTFWLMVTGSEEGNNTYALYWLYGITTDNNFYSTIELYSKNESISFSVNCKVNVTVRNKFLHVPDNLNCLIVNLSHLKSLAENGHEMNLRVTIH